ncbi:MAG: hypothetical protein SFY95_08480 [Planctomycetota bacterium]|nr:hypothetical protein [Planctomycetota bacterium]
MKGDILYGRVMSEGAVDGGWLVCRAEAVSGLIERPAQYPPPTNRKGKTKARSRTAQGIEFADVQWIADFNLSDTELRSRGIELPDGTEGAHALPIDSADVVKLAECFNEFLHNPSTAT